MTHREPDAGLGLRGALAALAVAPDVGTSRLIQAGAASAAPVAASQLEARQPPTLKRGSGPTSDQLLAQLRRSAISPLTPLLQPQRFTPPSTTEYRKHFSRGNVVSAPCGTSNDVEPALPQPRLMPAPPASAALPSGPWRSPAGLSCGLSGAKGEEAPPTPGHALPPKPPIPTIGGMGRVTSPAVPAAAARAGSVKGEDAQLGPLTARFLAQQAAQLHSCSATAAPSPRQHRAGSAVSSGGVPVRLLMGWHPEPATARPPVCSSSQHAPHTPLSARRPMTAGPAGRGALTTPSPRLAPPPANAPDQGLPGRAKWPGKVSAPAYMSLRHRMDQLLAKLPDHDQGEAESRPRTPRVAARGGTQVEGDTCPAAVSMGRDASPSHDTHDSDSDQADERSIDIVSWTAPPTPAPQRTPSKAQPAASRPTSAMLLLRDMEAVLKQRPGSRAMSDRVRDQGRPTTCQAAPMVLCLDSLLDSTPEVVELEMQRMSLEELQLLNAQLGGGDTRNAQH